MNGSGVATIAEIIQLAITPIFLLVAIGSLLNVMTGRLARIVDRMRKLEKDVLTADEQRRRGRGLDDRLQATNRAIAERPLAGSPGSLRSGGRGRRGGCPSRHDQAG